MGLTTKTIILLSTCLALCSMLLAEDETNKSIAAQPKPISKVKTASFTLKTGDFVYGKVQDDDRTTITMQVPQRNLLITNTYFKKEIGSRIVYRNISELEYWEETGSYFLKQTWDFRNDPDEFIMAKRCYEEALKIATESFGEDDPRTQSYQATIDKIENDKQKWIKDVSQRAEMNKLEFTAEFENMYAELRVMIEDNKRQLLEISKLREEIALLYNEIDKATQILYKEIDKVGFKADNNAADIRTLFRRNYSRPYYYYKPSTDSE